MTIPIQSSGPKICLLYSLHMGKTLSKKKEGVSEKLHSVMKILNLGSIEYPFVATTSMNHFDREG